MDDDDDEIPMEWIHTREPSDESSSDNNLSLSVYNEEQAADAMEELRRQREESARQYRCCICGNLHNPDEGQLLWHVNPWFFYALYVHDMHQIEHGLEVSGTPVSEVLRNAGILQSDGRGRNWVCICGPCQRFPITQQQRRPQSVPQATPSRSSNQGHSTNPTINHPTYNNWWAYSVEAYRIGPLEGLPEGHPNDDATGQHSPYSSADIPSPPGNTAEDGSSSSSTRTQLPPSMARNPNSARNMAGMDRFLQTFTTPAQRGEPGSN